MYAVNGLFKDYFFDSQLEAKNSLAMMVIKTKQINAQGAIEGKHVEVETIEIDGKEYSCATPQEKVNAQVALRGVTEETLVTVRSFQPVRERDFVAEIRAVVGEREVSDALINGIVAVAKIVSEKGVLAFSKTKSKDFGDTLIIVMEAQDAGNASETLVREAEKVKAALGAHYYPEVSDIRTARKQPGLGAFYFPLDAAKVAEYNQLEETQEQPPAPPLSQVVSTFKKCYNTIYKLDGFENGKGLVKMVLWIITLATALIPMGAIYAVAKLYDMYHVTHVKT